MDVPFLQISVIVPVGAASVLSSTTPERSYGLAHLLEHLCLVSSHSHPEPNAYSRLLTNAGGRWNAWTHDFYTEFFLTLPHTAVSTELLEGFLSHVFTPQFHSTAVAKEKLVIHEEAVTQNYYPGDNSVSHYKFTNWMQLASTNHAQVFGSTESFATIDTPELAALHSYYQSKATQIFLGGHLDDVLLQPLLENLTTTADTAPTSTFAPTWQNPEYRTETNAELTSPVLSWGGIFSATTLTECWGINFLLQLLTDPDYGTLNQWLRYEKSWSYGVYAFQTNQKDRFAWIIDIPLSTEKTAQQVHRQLHEQAAQVLQDSSLIKRVKQIELDRQCYELQTLTERMDTAIDTLTTFGSIPTETDYINWLTALDKTTLETLFTKFFTPDNTSTLLMIPSK